MGWSPNQPHTPQLTLKGYFEKAQSLQSSNGPVPEHSIAPLGDQPAARVHRHVESLDRLLDGRLLIGLVIDDADKPGGVPRKWNTAHEWFGYSVGCLAIAGLR